MASRHVFPLKRAPGPYPPPPSIFAQMPTWATLWDHVFTAQIGLFSYGALPLFAAFLAENKLTRAFSHISDVGLPMYLAYHAAYLACVEVGGLPHAFLVREYVVIPFVPPPPPPTHTHIRTQLRAAGS
jgi:hypothetical protein